MIFLGIDGGQTSTRVCLYDDLSGELLTDKGPQIDHMHTIQGKESSHRAIRLPLLSLLARYHRPLAADAAAISISGVHEEHKALIQNWVSDLIPIKHFIIEGDCLANLTGASEGKNDGVLVISGGGSFAYYPGLKAEYVSGGFGHILGDEGSAYWIGLTGLRSAVRSADGRGDTTVLQSRILDHFQADSFWAVKKWIHSDRLNRKDIADVAIVVEQAASEGDCLSQNIMQSAGRELGQLAVSVIRQAQRHEGALVNNVYPTGGVFRSKAWVMPSFTETIARDVPNCRIRDAAFPPVFGAVILAARAIKRDLNLEQLRKSLSSFNE